MIEYRIKWTQCPTSQHTSRVLFVEADTPELARAIAEDHIERTYGIGWFVISTVDPYVRPTGGQVLEK